MKIFILILLGFILHTSCSQVNDCGNRFDFISTNDSIPILKLDYSEAPESILKRMNTFYGVDLCSKCDWVGFKAPFEIEGKNGFLKLIADFDSPYCMDCPASIRKRSYFQIFMNSNNQILANDKLVAIDLLKAEIKSYLSKVGYGVGFPETYERVHYSIYWDRHSDSKFIDSVITSIFSTHTDFVATKVSADGLDFCSLEKTELTKLKKRYPIRIQINFGRLKGIRNPSEMEE